MKIRHWLILGLALLLVVPLTLSFPGNSQAQQNRPMVSHGPGMQGYGNGYYGNNGNSYRGTYRTPGSNYGYSAPEPRNYGNRGPRSWNGGNGNTWCPWNGGYAGNYRNSRGHCW